MELAKIKEAREEIAEAANVLQELQVYSIVWSKDIFFLFDDLLVPPSLLMYLKVTTFADTIILETFALSLIL